MRRSAIRTGLLATLCGLVALAAPTGAGAQAEKPMVDEVKARGVLRVGVKNDAPYLGFIDEKGKYAGFEIDLATDIARRLGVKIEFVPVKASNRVQLLQQKRIDMIMATLSHYRARDKVIDFSVAYLYTPQTLLVKKAGGIKSLKDLDGKRIGVDAGSGAVKKVPKIIPKAKVQAFQGWPEAFFALQRGTVDAVATDNILLAGLRASAPKPDEYVLLTKGGFYSGGYYAIGLRENDSRSRDTINFLLQDQWKDGTWQKTFDKWLGTGSKLKMSLADFNDFAIEYWD
ncbi:MAG: transporter substrate-binding domain-containing protein [Hyphomicrobiaceae bacterium]|nr:transporter substrate-binding domain-containing protein [Hyphomicrobiaceae bacterium]